MDQENTFSWGEWAFVQTANAAVRREAFEQVGRLPRGDPRGRGRRPDLPAEGAGWGVERREEARATHRSRTTVRALLRQQMHHGAGGAWLDREYPGSVPAEALAGLRVVDGPVAVTGLARAVRAPRPRRRLWRCSSRSTTWRELGRSMDNSRPVDCAPVPRPTVDVVVPFRGTRRSADAVARAAGRARAARGRHGAGGRQQPGPAAAPRRRAAAHALGRSADARRTRATRRAAGGSADWLVFCDADTSAPPDLLDRYFDPPPGERTGLLGGGVVDEPVPADARWSRATPTCAGS